MSVTLIGTVVLIGMLEGAGRAAIHFKYGIPGKTYGLWRHDDVLGAKHRENAYNTNAQTNDYGFRNREAVSDPKPLGALRIIAYGGSTTYCYNLTDEEAWPVRLQELLRERHHPHDQVLNGGAILWSIGHAFARAKLDIPVLRPDFVLIYSGINEDTNARHLAKQGLDIRDLVANGKPGSFATNLDQNRWLKRNSVVVRFAEYRFKPWMNRVLGVADETVADIADAAVSEKPPDQSFAVVDNYLAVLERFVGLARSYDAEPIFVIQAHRGDDPRTAHLTSYSRTGSGRAEDLGVTVIDAQQLVDGYHGARAKLFSDSGVHYSAIGAELLARLVYDEAFAGLGPGR